MQTPRRIEYKTAQIIFLFALITVWNVSCTKSKLESAQVEFISNVLSLDQLSIDYPKNQTLFPIDFQAPTFHWSDSVANHSSWHVCISDANQNILLNAFVETTQWKPDSLKWENLKKNKTSQNLQFSVIGFSKNLRALSGSKHTFSISEDSVGADIFFRAVTLPFSYAVSNVHTIEWYMGSIKGGAPRKMLDNMPVCANCHTFSPKGPSLAMDVDYGNDKGSYAIVEAKDTALMEPDDIISWSNFKKDEGDPTFGLLSQISPSGKYVLSTVKDLSVFAAVDNNLAYSQLFFPIKGIIGVYDIENKNFSELAGANNPKLVQSNPVWSPDNKTVLFTRTEAYINQTVRKHGNALLNIDDVDEFKDGKKEFKFDIYAVDFNKGKGGLARPLEGASDNGKSNYFPKYSPDGKWIVFCQAENFMLLQPDSKLYIMKADGTEARQMNCNTNEMNSWHSWSPNGKWLVFSSKKESLYTRLYLTHIDENGNDSPPVLLENLVFNQRAANIPEFFPGDASAFKRLKDKFSNTAPYYTSIAADNINSGYYLRAAANIKKAIQLDSAYIDAYIVKILLNSILQQVNSASEREDKAQALKIVNAKIDTSKTPDLELLFLKANLLTETAQYEQALKLLKDILSISPGYYRALNLMATIYKKTENSNQVLLTYNKMKKLVPANTLEINISMIRYYLLVNKVQDAYALLKTAQKEYPANNEIHELLCNIYLKKQNIAAAERELKLLFQSDSTNYNYYFLSAEIAEMENKPDKAKQQRSQAYQLILTELEKNAENVPLRFEKANYLRKNKDFNGALQIYNEIIRVLPYNYRALKEKARLMLAKQDWHNAILIYEQLIYHYEPEEEFFNNTAIACIKTGDYDKALASFEQTLVINPANVDALFNRAKLYEMLGDLEKANADRVTMQRLQIQ